MREESLSLPVFPLGPTEVCALLCRNTASSSGIVVCELYKDSDERRSLLRSAATEIIIMEDLIDPNATKEVAMTSLDWCARSRQLSLLNAVLRAHFSNCAISDLERECSRVLRNAVTSGCKDTLISLLRHVDDAFLAQRHEEGDDVRDNRTRLEKLLGLAVEHGHRDIADVLLSKGANPNQCYRNKPLLHLSLSLGHHDVASLLVERGADVNTIDSKGETPIFAALSSNSSLSNELIDGLIARGADVNHRSLTNRQPIHYAAMTSNVAVLTRLAEAGCDVGAQDGVLGDTPLHLACSRCCQEAVVTLVRHGADVNALNERGDTPLKKLLQHATRAVKDFHQDSRIKLARVLVAVGFRLTPCPSDTTRSFTSGELSDKNSSVDSDTAKSSRFTSAERLAERFSRKEDRAGYTCKPKSSGSGVRKVYAGRDKVQDVFHRLLNERRGVPALQHLCRLELRRHLPTQRFQERVAELELSPQVKQYLMFLPRLLDDSL